MAFKLDNLQRNKEQHSSFNIQSILQKEISLGSSSFGNKKKEAFYTELHVLVKAGLTLKDALALITEEQTKEADKTLLKTITRALIDGKDFSEAISSLNHFSDYEFYSLQIGEKTGTLEKIFEDLGLFYQRKNQQRRTIIGALSYPVIVLLTAFLAIGFMLKFVVPMFENIFKQNQTELPWITKMMIAASEMLEDYFWLLCFVLLLLIVFQRISRKKNWYRKYSASFWLQIPFVGEFIRKLRIAQFTQAIHLLTSAKVPLLQGIQLTKKMINYYPLQIALAKIEQDILQGKTLNESIQKYAIFDKKMSSLVKVAEETNQTATIFKRLSNQYNQEIDHKSKMISATIEPIIVLVLGAIVAVILIAMYLPMFTLSTVIG
ncbi:MAG: type II secretion system F family protein [Flavobacterium sp.]|jgi:type II secretory pathway component PulF|nr:type II secretion system F family protein [Flavobacterium sp.]